MSNTESKDCEPDMQRIIIFAITPDVQESHSVFQEVYARLDLPVDQYFHTFHADLKAAAYATGIEQAMCSFLCVFCEVQITVSTTLKQQMASGKSRSCRSNRQRFKKYLRGIKNGSKQAAFANRCCIYDPLPMYPQNKPIITWMRLPQVHLTLHFNWYIDKMEGLHPCVAEWQQHFHQVRSEYHGSGFEGPQIRRLIKSDSMRFLKELLEATSAAKGAWL